MSNRSDTFLLKLYAAALGAAATLVARKAVQAGWKLTTGHTPPDPSDPDVPARVAVTWALASAAGLAVAQVASNRLIARRYISVTGSSQPAPVKKRGIRRFL